MAVGPTTVYPSAVPISLAEGTPKTYGPVTTTAGAATATRTVPGEGAWYVLGARVSITTDANVANRSPILRITDGNTRWWEIALSNVIAAGTTQVFALAPSIALASVGLPGENGVVPLPNAVLEPGSTIEINLANVQVGDTITTTYRVLELPYGPTGYVRGPALIDTGESG